MDSISDNVRLELPLKAQYVSVVRLAVSGICSRIGFDIDAIEDVKVAISEVCNKIMKIGSDLTSKLTIEFLISEKRLDIFFYCDDSSIKCIFKKEKDELGFSIISAIMDNVEFCTEHDYVLTMSKVLEGNA